MRTITTLQEPDTGSITFGNIDVLQENDRVRQSLGYLPREFRIYPMISALEMLGHFAVLTGVTDRRRR